MFIHPGTSGENIQNIHIDARCKHSRVSRTIPEHSLRVTTDSEPRHTILPRPQQKFMRMSTTVYTHIHTIHVHPRVPLNRLIQVPESTTQSGYMCTREYHSIGLHTVMSCGNTAPYRAPESTTQSDTRPPESTTQSGHTCTREYHSIGLHMAASHPGS